MIRTFPTKTTTRNLTALVLISTVAVGISACSPSHLDGEAPTSSTGEGAETGDVTLALDVAPGITLNTVSYTITGPGGFLRTSSINVSASATLSALVSVIPPGTGYNITLTSISNGGGTTCAGSATFTVVARATTPVMVHLTCRESVTNGTVLINGNINVCPSIDGISASPSEVLVGATIALGGAAHDTDAAPAALSYSWTATSGTLSSASVANPVFRCTEPGAATLRLTVSDGDATVGCADTRSIVVVCTPGPNDFSFVVVGCNRIDPAAVTPAMAPDDFPSTANVAQLSRTFSEVAAMNPLPDYFFFAGDMVMGYTNDNAALRTQLQAWVDLYRASPLFGTSVKLVAIPGNHETQNASKVTTLAGEQAWLDIMGPYIAGSNGELPGGVDMLATDQSRLTYSFDHKGTHFVILDTDPQGRDWTVPVQWISADVTAARAAGANHILAIGHKPAYGWSGAPTDSLLGKGLTPTSFYLGLRDQFWSALEATQAEAMFAAHNHLWTKMRPNKTWQIIAGNGGSALEATVGTGTGGPGGGPLYPAYFGFTVVNVAAGGPVTLKSYGRDVPAAGFWAPAPAATYPTTVRDTQDITWM